MLYFFKGAVDVFVRFCNTPILVGYGFDVTVRDVIIFCLALIVLFKFYCAMSD